MRLFTLFSLLLTSLTATAQDPAKSDLAPCGAPPALTPWLRAYQDRPQDFAAAERSQDTLYAAMQVHLLARDNGTGRFSAERLQRLDAAIGEQIAARQLAGGVMVVLRDGRPVVFKAYGQQDIENARPMRTDTIFRIASMTKAITTVAAMILYEEGRFLLKDPVSRYLPAFAHLQVALPGGGTEKPRRPLTIHDLLTHTAGMSYGPGPAKAAYDAAGMKDWYLVGQDETLAQWTERFAALPLQSQPGEQFIYGYATDVLGRLVEVVSGMPLDRFIEQRITGPLRMRDTGDHQQEAGEPPHHPVSLWRTASIRT